MKITLTTKELEHAIACYLRANAAVEVGEMTFSLKKTGIETVVETTVKEARDPEEVVQGLKEPDIKSIYQASYEPTNEDEFERHPALSDFEHNAEELVDEIPEEIEPEQETESLEDPTEEESPQLDLFFESELETETVEEMPIQNTMSIADILGS